MNESSNGDSAKSPVGEVQAWYAQGLSRLEACEYAEAIAILSQVIARNGSLVEAFLYRGIALAHQESFDEALADFNVAIDLGIEPARAHLWRGHALCNLGEFEAALTDLNRAASLDPDDAHIYINRGLLHLQTDDAERALDDFNESIRRLADYGPTYFYRARAFVLAEEYEQAIADYTEAIRLDAYPLQAFYERGTSLIQIGELEEASSDLTEILRRDPTFAAAYLWRGRIHEWSGAFDAADADFETAERLEPAEDDMHANKTLILPLLESHFAPLALQRLSITERRFPNRVRADVQRALDDIGQHFTVRQFHGIGKRYVHDGVNFMELFVRDRNDPAFVAPPQYEEIDIGEENPIRVVRSGLWLLQAEESRFAIFLEPSSTCAGVRYQVAVVDDEQGARLSTKFFNILESVVKQAKSYRGKILSLEYADSYSGMSSGIRVHKLRSVVREQVILPARTIELLDRNVIRFVTQRPKLAALGLSTKKGLLFYGPPGTGKTHTLHYLTAALPDTTTLLISAEQVVHLAEYMTLARLLQPTMIVIEDADLIARNREQMSSNCEEALLNRLLNEMDGLKEDADILFVLTTNRPETLEAALSARPGRIDQAIEFPHPDAEGREKLVRLYAGVGDISDELACEIVKRTERVSAAFIKELMRRTRQFQLERDAPKPSVRDVNDALEELLVSGGSLNRKLLGSEQDA